LEERENITSFVTIPSSVSAIIGATLPEGNNAGASYISSAFDPNLVFTGDGKLTITFLHEGAGYKNSLGYFTYTLDASGNKTILDRNLLFANASYTNKGGVLDRGDSITISNADGSDRLFTAGQYVGLFIVSNGWNAGSKTVTGWDPASPVLPYLNASQNAGVANGVFSTWDTYNPEILSSDPSLARHMALFKVSPIAGFNNDEGFFITGFEDQRRDINSDEDFNDVVVMMRSSPESASADTNTPVYLPGDPDPDGDGCEGMSDFFPNDATRCTIVRTPATGYYTVAFEDNYPSLGDGDYNDSIVHFAHEEVLNGAGLLVDLVGTYHLTARGAGFDHAFGMSFEGLAGTEAGTVRVESFNSDGVLTSDGPNALSESTYTTVDGDNAMRIRNIFPSTRNALPGIDSSFTNTENATPESAPASARAKVTFSTPIARANLGTHPFDPFLDIKFGGGLYDIHLPGSEAFPDRPAELPDETAGVSFKDDDGYPWVIAIPSDWRHPLEGQNIGGVSPAYDFFQSWRLSAGASNLDWYDYPYSGVSARVVDLSDDSDRVRSWNLSAVSVE
jgi:LruC domain-containing protein